MMLEFWGIAAALMAAALWFVIPPLMRRAPAEGPSRRALIQAVYRDKLAELDADRERGTLDDAQVAQARGDLERQLLQDLLADQSADGTTERPWPRWLAPGLVVALPLGAVAFFLGQHSTQDQLPRALATMPATADGTAPAGAASGMAPPHPGAPGSDKAAGSMEEAAARLAQRLESNPNDADGWILLGNSYHFLHKDKEAEAAFARAKALGKTPPPAPSPGAGTAGPVAPAPAEAPGASTAAESAEAQPADLATLEKATAEHPKDARAWDALGRAYQGAKRFGDAAKAYGKAIALEPGNADWLADAADAVAAKNNSLEGEASTLIERALKADPHHVKALWLAASAARQRGKPAQALELWERLQKELPQGSSDASIIAANIEEARAELEGGERPPARAPPAATAAAAPPAASSPAVRGTVRLADAMKADVAADDTLFVFARAVTGPPMPLAVLRKRAGDLPLEFTLDDSLAVMPGAKLSSAAQVVVGARISKSGNATPQAGDLEGTSAPLSPAAAGLVELVIERRR